MSTTHALKDFELVIRQQASQEGREPISEDRVTLLKIRQLVAEYRLAVDERQGDLDRLAEDGEQEGSLAYDEQLASNEADAAQALVSLLGDLEVLVS
ncbi:hypothetical protein ACFYZ0_02535 [Streptomyces sp. NPDC001708]|uniref:hypothetical protein n=1 Tax=Streptomyces sp. NPDC001708 TaxID=3364602 RepID=UPI0036A49FD5